MMSLSYWKKALACQRRIMLLVTSASDLTVAVVPLFNVNVYFFFTV